jgi:hypothetical protein
MTGNMTRPEYRSKVLGVRLTPTAFDLVAKAAKRDGVSMSLWAWYKLLEAATPQRRKSKRKVG